MACLGGLGRRIRVEHETDAAGKWYREYPGEALKRALPICGDRRQPLRGGGAPPGEDLEVLGIHVPGIAALGLLLGKLTHEHHEVARRVHGFFAGSCPLYRTLGNSIAMTTELVLLPP